MYTYLLYVCIYTYTYVCIYTCIYMYYIYIHIHIHIYIIVNAGVVEIAIILGAHSFIKTFFASAFAFLASFWWEG